MPPRRYTLGVKTLVMNVSQLWINKKTFMKIITNVIVTHAVFLALFATAALAFAQTPTATTTNGQAEAETEMTTATTATRQSDASRNREEMREQATERRDAAQQEMTERRAQLPERAQERVTNLAANMSNRMDASIGRLQNIIDRLESRIEKVTTAGIDATASTEILNNAQTSLDLARTEIAAIDSSVAAAVSAENARTAWTAVRENFVTIRDYLTQSHQELRATVAALKEAVVEASDDSNASEAVQAETAAGTTTEAANADN